jgi:hypothetical protein
LTICFSSKDIFEYISTNPYVLQAKVEYSPVLIPNIQSSHPQHPSRYCFAVDKGTPDDVAALFHSIEIKMVMNLARAHHLICSLLAQIVHIAPLSPLTPPAEFQGKGELPST